MPDPIPTDLIAADKQAAAAATKADTRPEVEVADEDTKATGKPGEGRDFVELPPAAQKRFDRLYRQVKAQDEKLMLQGQHLQLLTGKLSKAEQAVNDERGRDAMERLRTQIKDARETGDEDKVEKLREQLGEVQAEIAINKRVQAAAPKPPAQPPESGPIPMSKTDVVTVRKWSDEVDGDGNFKRPWTQDGHSKVDDASDYLAQLVNSPDHEDLTMAEKLEMVDKKFGVKQPGRREAGAQVAGADLTGAAATGKPRITSEQARVAEKLFPNLSKTEAHKAYVEGMK